MIIAYKDFQDLKLSAATGAKEFDLNVNLGKKRIKVKIENGYALFPGLEKILISQKIKEKFLYLIKEDELLPIAFFSENTNYYYKLTPTADWPTVSISSVPMHKISLSSPRCDVEAKVRFLKPKGVHLDTCAGLGYTAILASREAFSVYTFEKDENIVEIASINPFSEELFNQKNIIFKNADIKDEIDNFDNDYFDSILHDPPTFKISPVLYSQDFYSKLYRVLKKGAYMYHYTPLVGIKKKRDYPAQVKKKLISVGFKVINYDEVAQGFLCMRK